MGLDLVTDFIFLWLAKSPITWEHSECIALRIFGSCLDFQTQWEVFRFKKDTHSTRKKKWAM